MAQTSKQINKVLLLLTFLLLNSFIISCDCKGEKGKLEAEEKVLMEKLKNQLRPEVWAGFEASVKQQKHSPLKTLEKELKIFKSDLASTEQIERENYNSITVEVLWGHILFISALKGTSIDPESVVMLAKSLENETLGQILQNSEIQKILKDKNNFVLLKQFLTDKVSLYQNFVNQAKLNK